MEVAIASQECCLHDSVLFTRRYVTFVLVIMTFVFTLYSVVVLEKNRTRTTIFKSILEQLIGNNVQVSVNHRFFFVSESKIHI